MDAESGDDDRDELISGCGGELRVKHEVISLHRFSN